MCSVEMNVHPIHVSFDISSHHENTVVVPSSLTSRDNYRIHPDKATTSLPCEKYGDRYDFVDSKIHRAWPCHKVTRKIHPEMVYEVDVIDDNYIPECEIKYKPTCVYQPNPPKVVKLDKHRPLVATPVPCSLEETSEAHNPLITDMNYLYIPNVAFCSQLVDITLLLESSSDLDAFVASLVLPKEGVVVRSLTITTANSSVDISEEAMHRFLSTLSSQSSQNMLKLERLTIEYIKLRGLLQELRDVLRAVVTLQVLELASNGLHDRHIRVREECTCSQATYPPL